MSRSSSGSLTESGTPLKLLQHDESTGEYTVSMSPAEFDRLASQPRATAQNAWYSFLSQFCFNLEFVSTHVQFSK